MASKWWWCPKCRHEEPAQDEYEEGDAEPCVHCDGGTAIVSDSRHCRHCGSKMHDTMETGNPDGNWICTNCKASAEANAALRAEIERLKEWQRQMVEKAAAKSLDGYRELGAMCASLSIENERLRAYATACREWLKGCTCAAPDLQDECQDCTTAFLRAIRRAGNKDPEAEPNKNCLF